MTSGWPQAVLDFGVFLRERLAVERQDERAAFGDRLLQFGDDHIRVRAVSERGIWYVELAGGSQGFPEWFDAALVRSSLLGEERDILSLGDQIEFVQGNWAKIVEMFSQKQIEGTQIRLDRLRSERANRRFAELLRG
jgi:hypothetical protein